MWREWVHLRRRTRKHCLEECREERTWASYHREPLPSPAARQQMGSRTGKTTKKGDGIGGHSGSLRCSHTRQCHFLFRFFFPCLVSQRQKVPPSRFACSEGSYIIIIVISLGGLIHDFLFLSIFPFLFGCRCYCVVGLT